MSLISDALKRQEQLRASGTGAVPPEVAAAVPPEVAAAVPPEVAAAVPPEVAAARPPEVAAAVPPEVAAAAPPEASRDLAAPNFAAPAAQPRRASGPASPPQGAQPRAAWPRQTSPRQRPNLAPAGGPTSRGAAAQNPFLERERAASRRSNPSVLLMPVLGIIVLLVLLFLRREFVPGEEVGVDLSHAPRKVEESPPAPIVLSRDDSSRETNAEGGDGVHGASAEPGASAGRMPALPGNGETSISFGVSDSSAALREQSAPPQPSNQPTDQPSNRQTVKPSNPAAEAEPQSSAWPSFTLTGIAVGRERIAVLSTGEMLLAGEMSKCGVKVKKVNASTVVFAWGGETKTLRKGEHSDKPAD